MLLFEVTLAVWLIVKGVAGPAPREWGDVSVWTHHRWIVAVASGFVAPSVFKGAALHRKSGMVFGCAMLTMALLGAMMAAVPTWAREAQGIGT